jgi:hypothetical protein
MSGGSVSPARPERLRAARRLWVRVPLLLGGGVGLVLGAGTGLQRLGWGAFSGMADLAELHGPLMVCGFFGTVISIERAVALGRNWAYWGPFAAVLATVATVMAMPLALAQAGWIVAGGILSAASAVIAWRHRGLSTATLFLGAAAWAAGTTAWTAGAPMQHAALWWISFLVLTISAERLEFSRVVRRGSVSLIVFGAFVVLLLAAATAAAIGGALAWTLAGAALLCLVTWLLRHDIARRTIRLPGLPRYVASCLLSGYAWLAVAGLMMLLTSPEADRLAYDAILHAAFLGFALAMIFGHAPIILPAVAGVKVAFSALFYAPLVILNVSVAMRVGADLAGALDARRWSGMLTVLALAAFAGGIIAAARSARLHGAKPQVCPRAKTPGADDATLIA